MSKLSMTTIGSGEFAKFIKTLKASDAYTSIDFATRDEIDYSIDAINGKAKAANAKDATSGTKGGYTRSLAGLEKEITEHLTTAGLQEALATHAAPAPKKKTITAKQAMAKIKDAPAKAAAKKAKALTPCLCGCGEMVAKLFKQGHDQRLKGWIIRAATGVQSLDAKLVMAQLHKDHPESKKTMDVEKVASYITHWEVKYKEGKNPMVLPKSQRAA